ncbi:Maf family nucleotide pyrophosphatase [Vibrio sp.]|nr:Maf family nucleotide pyrophosphatase [Vibrio sp.]
MQNIILASQSPRRQELLKQLSYSFSIDSANVPEQQRSHESAIDYVQRLSQEKAAAVMDKHIGQQATIIGADTIVVCQGKVLEKPENYEHSKEMLLMLSGQKHQVMTAVTVLSEVKKKTKVVTTNVHFRALNDEEIKWYWSTKEPMDKAGSYAIQGLGGRFITHIEGSYYAVVGLPLYETEQLLKEFLND